MAESIALLYRHYYGLWLEVDVSLRTRVKFRGFSQPNTALLLQPNKANQAYKQIVLEWHPSLDSLRLGDFMML